MVERTVRTLHEDNLQAEVEFTGRMKELKRDVDQKQAEKEEQQLAFQRQLAAARQARLRLEAVVLQPRPQPMSIERPENVHERTAMWAHSAAPSSVKTAHLIAMQQDQ
jgi:hypothetical protein